MSKFLDNANNAQNCSGCESKSLLNINCDEDLIPNSFDQMYLMSPSTVEENPIPTVVSLNIPVGTTGSLGPIQVTIPFGTVAINLTALGGGSVIKIFEYMFIPDLITAFIYVTIGNSGTSDQLGGNTIINIGNHNFIANGGNQENSGYVLIQFIVQ